MSVWVWRVITDTPVEFEGEKYGLGDEFEATVDEIAALGIRSYLSKVRPAPVEVDPEEG